MAQLSVSELLARALDALPSDVLDRSRLQTAARSLPIPVQLAGGLVVGIAIGWLTAPASGAELRKALARKARELGLLDNRVTSASARIAHAIGAKHSLAD